MDDIVIYEKTTCSTCRVAISLVKESGRPMRRVRYYDERLDKRDLQELVRKLGMRPAQLVRKKEALYKEMAIDADTMPDDQVLDLLVENPDLLERPIVVCGDRAILGRPTEKVSVFLKELGAL